MTRTAPIPTPGKDPKSLQDQETQAPRRSSWPCSRIGDWRQAIYARLVDKVGDRAYWEDWAKDIAAIAQAHVTRIKAALALPDKRAAFEEFVAELRATINPGVTEADAIDMLAQHLITKPVFDALFGSYAFAEHNPVSQAMQSMLDALGDQGLDTESKNLAGLLRLGPSPRRGHRQPRRAAAGHRRAVRQVLQDRPPKTADALGIVYTPVEIVDFILRAADRP